ncbi:MAG: hypothetical protein WBX20_10220, partial [Terrimicrobiaceae bacterium]
LTKHLQLCMEMHGTAPSADSWSNFTKKHRLVGFIGTNWAPGNVHLLRLCPAFQTRATSMDSYCNELN